MKKKIIITVCMAMTVLTGLAQSPLSFHAKAGIGTSHFHGKHSSSDTQIAYKAGVGAEYVLNKTWVLQSALEFVSIGGKDEISHIGKAKMHELYLQIPLMIAARLHLGRDYHAFDAGIALGLTFEYRRFIIGAETQVGLVKVNEQINQMIGHSEEGGYFPKNFAAFFTLGYRFW